MAGSVFARQCVMLGGEGVYRAAAQLVSSGVKEAGNCCNCCEKQVCEGASAFD